MIKSCNAKEFTISKKKVDQVYSSVHDEIMKHRIYLARLIDKYRGEMLPSDYKLMHNLLSDINTRAPDAALKPFKRHYLNKNNV